MTLTFWLFVPKINPRQGCPKVILSPDLVTFYCMERCWPTF